ncbi:uncharacterized protein Tco025E_00344 [Trypanosoma conorhini]|uniref:Uncharacterized protein n=1 Tax=Trypanosoma conorhini TaxID=83891 RepID=A0A422QBS5_9TRYP|nr:uncharacterized protein Tco025E_00344 [Trypanosoma conorhini]RNF27414.1 hypothetical protein Tco025E_00344 [Trypanosoma conorhini]
MEWARGLNCSSELGGSRGGVDPRKVWEQTVAANQQLLNIVKERETRATATAALFRSRHFALLQALAAAEAEVAALNARSRNLVAALRAAQLRGAGQAQHIDNIHATGAARTPAVVATSAADAEDDYAQLLQRLTHTGRLRAELQAEVQQLQSTCKAALQERAVLLRSLEAQREALEPLLRDADSLARAEAEVRATLRTYGDGAVGAGRAALLQRLAAWSCEEARAVRGVTALLSGFIDAEDENLRAAAAAAAAASGRLRGVEAAVRFQQTWNDALLRSIGAFSSAANARREELWARVEELRRRRARDEREGGRTADSPKRLPGAGCVG